MILAFDTSSAACSAAVFDPSGACVDSAEPVIGRGHAEKLVPLLRELLAGRAPTHVLVGVGPGSFTGMRVGIAAAHGLAIGWGCALSGIHSLALIAAAAIEEDPGGTGGDVAAVVDGGHGELFVQQFRAGDLAPASPLLNLPAAQAARRIDAPRLAGPAATALAEARGWGECRAAWPSARCALRLPPRWRDLAPRPVYAREPDARASAA